MPGSNLDWRPAVMTKHFVVCLASPGKLNGHRELYSRGWERTERQADLSYTSTAEDRNERSFDPTSTTPSSRADAKARIYFNTLEESKVQITQHDTILCLFHPPTAPNIYFPKIFVLDVDAFQDFPLQKFSKFSLFPSY